MNEFAAADKLKIKDRVLHLLKTGGPQTATALAEQLDVSPMAIRQHLQTLQSDRWVTYSEERQPVGRPVKLWQLTEQAANRFPDNHAELVVKLIQGVRHVFGDEGLESLLGDRARSQIQTYAAQLPENSDWQERVAALAELRSQEGYMAEAIELSADVLLLVENHCSICTAARDCPRLCSLELEVFEALLEPTVTIERVEHILNGDRRCAYRICKSQKQEKQG